jgi:hypothetical protein
MIDKRTKVSLKVKRRKWTADVLPSAVVVGIPSSLARDAINLWFLNWR